LWHSGLTAENGKLLGIAFDFQIICHLHKCCGGPAAQTEEFQGCDAFLDNGCLRATFQAFSRGNVEFEIDR